MHYIKELFLHSTLNLPSACLEHVLLIPTQYFWGLLQAEAEEVMFADSAVLGSTHQHQKAT